MATTTYDTSSRHIASHKEELQQLLLQHKSRYRSEHLDVTEAKPIVTKRNQEGNDVTYEFPAPLSFLAELCQVKRYIALGSEVSSFCNYITYEWLNESPELLKYKWLVRIKASDIGTRSLETALFSDVIRASDELTIPTKEEVLAELLNRRTLLIVEGDTDDMPEIKTTSAMRNIGCFLFVTQRVNTVHTQHTGLLNVRVYFEFPSSWSVEHPVDSAAYMKNTSSNENEQTSLFESLEPKTIESIRKKFDQLFSNYVLNEKDQNTYLIPPKIEKTTNNKDTQKRTSSIEDFIICDTIEFLETKPRILHYSRGRSILQNEENIEEEHQSQGHLGHVVTFQNVLDTDGSTSDEYVTCDEEMYGIREEITDCKKSGPDEYVTCDEDNAEEDQNRKYQHTETECDRTGSSSESDASDNEELEALCDQLSAKEGWPAGCEGMYVEGEHIIIDVLTAEKQQVKEFVVEECETIFKEANVDPKHVVVFVEQEGHAQYCVKRGDAICHIPLKDVFHKVVSCPDLRGITCIQRVVPTHDLPYGTVACVSEMPKDLSLNPPLCIITARHIFESNPESVKDTVKDSDKLRSDYMCENDGKLDYVAKRSVGIFGGSANGNKGVDISIIPIDPKERLPQGTSGGTSGVPRIFQGERRQLKRKYRKVEKLGATIPSSTGIIRKINFRANIAGKLRDDCILVVPDSKSDAFSKGGDSGALVISRVKEGIMGIGLICSSWNDWKNSKGETEAATIVVLLKNCFDAIEEELGTKLQLCAVWEDCSVKPLSKPVYLMPTVDTSVPSSKVELASIEDASGSNN